MKVLTWVMAVLLAWCFYSLHVATVHFEERLDRTDVCYGMLYARVDSLQAALAETAEEIVE